MAGTNGSINNRKLTEEEDRAKQDGQEQYVSGVTRVTETQKTDDTYVSSKGLYEKSLGVTKYENLRKMVGLKDNQSFTDYYTKHNGYVPKGYENDARALLSEEKKKKYAAQYEAGEIGYADFLMSAYGKDIMKANGDDLTSTSYWYNRAKSGRYDNPLDNDYYFDQVISAAEAEYEASEWYEQIYSKNVNDTTLSYLTGVTLDAEQFSEIFPQMVEMASQAFDDNIDKLMTYYRAGYISSSEEGFNPFVDADDDGKYDYYYHTDGRLYAIKGSHGTGTKWAELKYDSEGNIDRVTVDGFINEEYTQSFISGVSTFWGGIIDLLAMAGSGFAAIADGDFAGHYAEWEAIKNSKGGVLLGGAGDTQDFNGGFGSNQNGDNIGRGISNGIGAIVPMVVLAIATAPAGGVGGWGPAAGKAGAQAGVKASIEAAKVAGKSAAWAATKAVAANAGKAIWGATKWTAKTLSGFRGGNLGLGKVITGSASSWGSRLIDAGVRAVTLAARDGIQTYVQLDGLDKNLRMNGQEGFDENYKVASAFKVGVINAAVSFVLGANNTIGSAGDRFVDTTTHIFRNSTIAAQKWFGNMCNALSSVSTSGMVLGTAADIFENLLTMTVQSYYANGERTSIAETFGNVALNPQSIIMNAYIGVSDMGLPNTVLQRKGVLGGIANALGGSSLRSAAVARYASQMAEAPALVRQLLERNKQAAIVKGDQAKVEMYQALQNQFETDMSRTDVDGTKLDAYGSALEALMRIDQGLKGVSIESLDAAQFLKNYLDEESYKSLTMLSSNEELGPVSALLGAEIRKAIKADTLKEYQLTYNRLKEYYSNADSMVKGLFFGNRELLKLENENGRSETFNYKSGGLKLGHKAYGLQGVADQLVNILNSFNGDHFKIDKLDIERELVLTRAIGFEKGSLGEKEFQETFEKFFDSEWNIGSIFDVDAEGNATANTSTKIRKSNGQFRSQERAAGLGKLAQALIKSGTTIEQLRKLGLVINGVDGEDNFFGAYLLRAKTADDFGDTWNDVQKDESYNKMRLLMQTISSLYGKQYEDGSLVMNYDNPLFVRVTVNEAEDGQPPKYADYYIVPQRGLFHQTKSLQVIGSTINAFANIILKQANDAESNDIITRSLQLIGIASDQNTAEDPSIVTKEQAINKGISTMLETMAFDGKDDSKALIPRSRLIQLMSSDDTHSAVITKEQLQVIGTPTSKKALDYYEKAVKIQEEIAPLLYKVSEDNKNGKHQFTGEEIDKLSEFMIAAHKRSGAQKDIYDALITDKVIPTNFDEFFKAMGKDFFYKGQGEEKLKALLGNFLQEVSDGEVKLNDAQLKAVADEFAKLMPQTREERQSQLSLKFGDASNNKLRHQILDDIKKAVPNVDSDDIKTISKKLLKTLDNMQAYEYSKAYKELKEIDELAVQANNNGASGSEMFDFITESYAENHILRRWAESLQRRLDGADDLTGTYAASIASFNLKLMQAAVDALPSPDEFAYELQRLELNKITHNGVDNSLLLFNGMLDDADLLIMQNQIENCPALKTYILNAAKAVHPTEEYRLSEIFDRPIQDINDWMIKTFGVREGTNNGILGMMDRIMQEDIATRHHTIQFTETNVAEELRNMASAAYDLFYNNTEALPSEDVIRVNFNILHGEAYNSLMAKAANQSNAVSMAYSIRNKEIAKSNATVELQEKILLRIKKKYNNGIAEFNLNNYSEREEFKDIMNSLGYSGNEIISSKTSTIDGLYHLQNASRGVEIEVGDAKEFFMELDKHTGINEYYNSIDYGKVDVKSAIEELFQGMTYITEDTVIYNPKELYSAAVTSFDDMKLTVSDQLQVEDIKKKQGVLASKVAETILVLRNMIAIKGNKDTETTDILKLLDVIETAAAWANETDNYKTISQRVNPSDAEAIKKQYYGNTLWALTTKDIKDGKNTVAVELQFTLKPKDGKEFKARAIEMISKGKFQLDDIIPVRNFNQRTMPASERYVQGEQPDLVYIPYNVGGADLITAPTNAQAQTITSYIIGNAKHKMTLQSLVDMFKEYDYSKYEFDSIDGIFNEFGEATVRDILAYNNSIGSKTNFWLKTLTENLRMGMALVEKMYGEDLLTASIVGDAGFRTRLGNLLNAEGKTRLSDIKNISDEKITEIATKLHTYLTSEARDTAGNNTGEYYGINGDYAETSALHAIGMRYNNLTADDITVDDIAGVVRNIVNQLDDYTVRTDKSLVIGFEKHNPYTNLRHLVREYDGKLYIDVNSLKDIEEADIDLLKKLLNKYNGSTLQQKLDALKEAEPKPLSGRLPVYDGEPSAIISDTGLDTKVSRKAMMEYVNNRFNNKRVKMRAKISTMALGHNEQEDLVRGIIKLVEGSALQWNDNAGSTMVVNINNKIAAGQYLLSIAGLSEAIKNTFKSGNTTIPLVGGTDAERDATAFKIALNIALYSSGVDYSSEYARWIVYDSDTGEVKPLASTVGADRGMSDLFKNLLNNDVWDKDNRKNGLVLFDVSKNALLNSNGAVSGIKYADLNDLDVRIRLADGAAQYATQAYINSYGNTDTDINTMIATVFSRVISKHEALENMYAAVRSIRPEAPEEVVKGLGPTAFKLAVFGSEYNAKEEAFHNLSHVLGFETYKATQAMLREAKETNDLIVFGISKETLSDKAKVAMSNVITELGITEKEKTIVNLIFDAQYRTDERGQSIYTPNSDIHELEIRNRIDELFKNVTDPIEQNKIKRRMLQYAVLSRQRGKDINTIFYGKTLSEIFKDYNDAQVASIDDYTKPIKLASGKEITYSQLKNIPYVGFDSEAFFKTSDVNHNQARVYQISFKNYKDSSDKTGSETTILFRYDDLNRINPKRYDRNKGEDPSQYYYTSDDATLKEKYFDIIAGGDKDVTDINGNRTIVVTVDPENKYVDTVTNIIDGIKKSAAKSGSTFIGVNSSNYDIPIINSRFNNVLDGIDHIDIQHDILRRSSSTINPAARKDSMDYYRGLLRDDSANAHDAMADINFMMRVLNSHVDGVVNTKEMQSVLMDDIFKLAKAIDPNFVNSDFSALRDMFGDDVFNQVQKRLHNDIGDYIDNYKKYGKNFDNKVLHDLTNAMNEQLYRQEFKVTKKQYREAWEKLAGIKNIDFIEHFTKRGNSENVVKLVAALEQKLLPMFNADDPVLNSTAKEGLYIELADLISIAASETGKAETSDATIQKFFMSSLDEQIEKISTAIIIKAKDNPRYTDISITREEVNNINDLKTRKDIESLLTTPDVKNGKYIPSPIRQIVDRLEENTATYSYVNTMAKLCNPLFKEMPETLQNLFMNKFATLYGRDTTKAYQERKARRKVIASAFSDQIDDLISSDNDVIIPFNRQYDMVKQIQAGTEIKLADGTKEIAQTGTLYISQKIFSQLFGIDDYSIAATNLGSGDGTIYTQAIRYPGFKLDNINTVRIKIVAPNSGIETMGMDSNYFLTHFAGDNDGDKIVLINPSQATQAFGEQMHKVNQSGWGLATNVLEQLNNIISDNKYASTAYSIGELTAQNDDISKAFKNTYNLISDKNVNRGTATVAIAELEKLFKDKAREIYADNGLKATDEDIDALWKMQGINVFYDTRTNATDGGIKYYSYAHCLADNNINRSVLSNKAAAGFLYHDILQLNSSIPGTIQKRDMEIAERLSGNISDIYTYTPIRFSKSDLGKLQAIASKDSTALAKIGSTIIKAASNETKNLVETIINTAIQEKNGSLIVTALQVVEADARHNASSIDALKNAFASVNTDQKFAEERSKIARLKQALTQHGISEDVLKSAGVDTNVDENNYFALQAYRNQLLDVLVENREDYKFAGVYNQDMRGFIAAALFNEDQEIINNQVQIFTRVGSRDINGTRQYPNTVKLEIELVPFLSASEDTVYMTRDAKALNLHSTHIAQYNLPAGRKLTNEAIKAWATGKPIDAGTQITDDASGGIQNCKVYIVALYDKNGRKTNKVAEARSYQLATRRLIGSDDERDIPTIGAHKLSLAGAGAGKVTIGGYNKNLLRFIETKNGKEYKPLADFVMSEELFNQKKITPLADYEIVEREDVNGEKHRVLIGQYTIGENTSFWNSENKNSVLDDIIMPNTRTSADSFLMVGDKFAMYNKADGTIEYNTENVAKMAKLMSSVNQPEYNEFNAANTYKGLILYNMLMAIKNKPAAQKLIGIQDGVTLSKDQLNQAVADFVIKCSRSKMFAGDAGDMIINRIKTLFDNSELSKFKEEVLKNKMLAALFSEDMERNFRNPGSTALNNRQQSETYGKFNLGYSSKNGKSNINPSDRYFSKDVNPDGLSVVAAAHNAHKYISGANSYYPMRNFINDLIALGSDGDGFISTDVARRLTESGLLNTAHMFKGHIGTEFNPINGNDAIEVGPDQSRNINQQKAYHFAATQQRANAGTAIATDDMIESIVRNAADDTIKDYRKDWEPEDYTTKFKERFEGTYSNTGKSKMRGTRIDKVLKYLLAASAIGKTEYARAAILNGGEEQTTVNRSPKFYTTSNGEVSLTYAPTTKTVDDNQVKSTMYGETTSHNYFDVVEAQRKGLLSKAENAYKTAAETGDISKPYFNPIGETNLSESDRLWAISHGLFNEDKNFNPFNKADYEEHYGDFFKMQSQYEKFYREALSGTRSDTEIEKAATFWDKQAGDTIHGMKKSWLSTSGIKAADDKGGGQAQELDRMVAYFRATGRNYFNEMLGDEYRSLHILVSMSDKATEGFQKYSYLMTALAKLEYIEKNRKQVEAEVVKQKLTYQSVLDQAIKDMGGATKEQALEYINLYQKYNTRIVQAYNSLNKRIKQFADYYSKVTNQPLSNLFWFGIPMIEHASKRSKGERYMLQHMGNSKIDRNLGNAIMNKDGLALDEIYPSYDYMASIAKNVEQLSKVMSVVNMASQMREKGIVNNTLITDVVQKHLGEYLDAQNLSVGSIDRESDTMQDYRIFESLVVSLGVQKPMDEASTPYPGQKYAALYKAMQDTLDRFDDKYQNKSQSELVSMLNSAVNPDEQETIRKMLLIKSSQLDAIVKLSALQSDKDNKSNTVKQNILVTIFNEINEIAKSKGYALVDRYGRKIDIDNGKDWYSLSEHSAEHWVTIARYTSSYEGGRKANAALDMISGDLYFMDSVAAERLLDTTFTRVEPGKITKFANAVKNISTNLIMASPIKLLSRMLNFSLSDIGFALTADRKIGLALPKAMRDIRQFKQSKGTVVDPNLKAYMSLVDTGEGMFYGEQMKRLKGNNIVSKYLNFTNDMFNMQTMFVRYAMFNDLSKRFEKYGDGIIPAHEFGASYKNADAINKITSDKLVGLDGVEITRAHKIAAKIVADTFGNNNDMPYIARKLSQKGFMFTTFPLALVRFGMNTLSSTALAVRDAFTANRYGNSGSAWKHLALQGVSLVTIYALAAAVQIATNSDTREALWDAITGEELDEEQEKELKSFLFQDGGTVLPFESLLSGETKKNRSLFINPYASLKQMFIDPFANAAEGKTNFGTDSEVEGPMLHLINFINENIYSHLPAQISYITDSLPQNTMFGYTFNNDSYKWYENFARKLAGTVVGSEVASACANDWKATKYEDISFTDRLESAFQRAFIEETTNADGYKSAWKNYRNAFSIVYDYKALTDINGYSTVNTYIDNGYSGLAGELRRAMEHQSSITAIYNIIEDYKNKGVDIGTIRSALNNCSLRYKINRLSNKDEFINQLTDKELNTIKSALTYEDQMFPYLDEVMDEIETEYRRATSNGYRTNALNSYYNGSFHNLPVTRTNNYSYSGYRNNQYFGNNNYYSGRNVSLRNSPFDVYRQMRQRLEQQQQQLEYKKRQDSYKDYNFKLPGEK